MGSCISKCIPNKEKFLEEDQFNHVIIHDKLVISQPPKTPTFSNSNKISPSPPSPTNSSSFTCTNSTNTISSASSLSSSASSILSSKDRSFSNEFLWSCYKDNPHIIGINSLKEKSLSLLSTTKAHTQNLKNSSNFLAKPTAATGKHSSPKKVIVSNIPQKRVRSSSPANLTRQKSFRKEPQYWPASYSMSSRTLRSPSPSRRFSINGIPKANTVDHNHSVSSLMRKENNQLRPASPNNNSRRLINNSGLRYNKETCTYRVGSKIDEAAVEKALSNHDHVDSNFMEDIDNPLISLDCFIFL
ncbi:integrator complex subunit 6-like [Quillaja saponaria]|uniref:Integrator complex subunit 6-like n=1 Tax=Quillaja saponaria TaxID=32244 RepID=A0AAD7PLI2_QUISA|nr:integrator complex subunit 6-like [Quillaja saponaria]